MKDRDTPVENSEKIYFCWIYHEFLYRWRWWWLWIFCWSWVISFSLKFCLTICMFKISFPVFLADKKSCRHANAEPWHRHSTGASTAPETAYAGPPDRGLIDRSWKSPHRLRPIKTVLCSVSRNEVVCWNLNNTGEALSLNIFKFYA